MLRNWGFPCTVSPHGLLVPPSQNEYYCRLDFLWKKKLRHEQEETETMENLTRLLLENVLPAHVAPQFIGQNRRNEVSPCPETTGINFTGNS